MYRLRQMDVDDKVCEQVSLTMLEGVYPAEVIKRCVQHSEPWSSKVRRVRLCTALTLVLFVIGMALWSRRNQCQVWQSLVGKREPISVQLRQRRPAVIRDSGDGARPWGASASRH
jgi:Insertion element 4 transposase N-terminal